MEAAAMRVVVPGGKLAPCASLKEADKIIRSYTFGMDCMGSSEFYSTKNVGLVVDAAGKQVARISYNGRVWDPVDESKEIFP